MLPTELLSIDPAFGYEKTVLLVCALVPASVLWFCATGKSKKHRRKKSSNLRRSENKVEAPGKKVENTERLSIHGEIDDDDPIKSNKSHTELPADIKQSPVEAVKNPPAPLLQDAREPTVDLVTPNAKTPKRQSVDQPPPKFPQKKSKKTKKKRRDTADVPPSEDAATKNTQEPLSREDPRTMATQDEEKPKPHKDTNPRPTKTCETQNSEEKK